MYYQQLIREIESKVNPVVLNEFVDHLNNKNNTYNLHLWGSNKNRSLIKKNLYAGLYRDLFVVSYNKVSEYCRTFLHIPGSTLSHNYHIIRYLLHDYCFQRIKIGDRAEWDRIAQCVNKSDQFADVNLWIESKDFQCVVVMACFIINKQN